MERILRQNSLSMLLITQIIFFSTRDDHFYLMDLRKKMWNFESMGESLQSSVKKEIRDDKVLRCAFMILSLITSFSSVPLSVDLRQLLPFLYFMENMNGFEYFMFIMYIFQFFGRIYVSVWMTLPNFVLLIGVKDIKFSMMLIRENLSSIDRMLYENKLNWDIKTQEILTKNLVKCIKRYSYIKKYKCYLDKMIDRGMYPINFCGVFFMAMFYFTLTEDCSSGTILRAMVISITVFFYLLQFAHLGQTLENENELLYWKLWNCNWILLDKSNKTIFMIFFSYVGQNLEFKGIQNMHLNYSMIVTYLRAVCSFLATIRNLASTNKVD